MNPSIADILAIVSLLVTILTFFLNLGWRSIDVCLNAENPPAGRAKERERQQQKIKACGFMIVAPTLISLALLMYVNFPTFIRLLESSKLSLWDFDVTKTLFCLMEIALFVFVLIILNVSRKLFSKYRELN